MSAEPVEVERHGEVAVVAFNRPEARNAIDDALREAFARALDEVAAAHDASVASVALAWLAAQPTITAPIASARTTDQLPDLLASVSLELTADELAVLDGASEQAKAA